MNIKVAGFVVQPSVAIGALAAAVLGALFSLEFDRLVAVANHVMRPAGQKALLDALGAATLGGLLICGGALLTTWAIRRRLVRPYLVLTEHLEGYGAGSPLQVLQDTRQPPAVHRLARAILAVQDQAVASQSAAAELLVRYEALCGANARERQSLMAILMEKATGRAAAAPPSAVTPAPSGLVAIPERAPPAAPAGSTPVLLPALVAPQDLFGPMMLASRPARTTAH